MYFYNTQDFSRYHFVERPPQKLPEQVSDAIRPKHYSSKLEKAMNAS
jgi:hypothetical protein